MLDGNVDLYKRIKNTRNDELMGKYKKCFSFILVSLKDK